MLKRRIAGGYEASSDGPEDDLASAMVHPAKKDHSAVFVPPRFTMAPKPPTDTFHLPTNHRNIRESVPKAPSASTVPKSKERRSLVGMVSDSDFESEGTVPLSPSINIRVTTGAVGQIPQLGNIVPNGPALARSALSLERHVNELTTTFHKYKEITDERHQQTDEKLTRLLEAVGQWSPAGSIQPGWGVSLPPDRPGSVSSGPEAMRSYLSNPMPTPAFVEMVSRVVGDMRARAGRKKGGMEDNSVKEHTRNTFYRMLGISAAKGVHPYFEDEHGEPDTLPAQFVDRESNYCQPYPHWKVPLTKQVLWIPTYVLRFEATIPNDNSEQSKILRELTEEQIVILLNDGPFRSAQTAWRDMKKTDEEVEAMRLATTQGRYIQQIPSLHGPAWEFLSHPRYMSQEESDEEGEVITRRPDYRPQWVNNLYKAIRVAERKKARPGTPPPVQLRVEVVKSPIHHLERGTGANKVMVQIAWSGISKAWREKHPEDYRKYAHLVNSKATSKPDINAFLAEHPMSTDDIGNPGGGLEQGSTGRTQIGEGSGA